MQYNLNLPIPLLVLFMTAILALIAYFIKDVHKDIKKVIEGLTKAVHGLEIVTTNMETKGNHIKERVEDLESQYSEHQPGLDWLKRHLSDLESLVYKKHREK